MSASKRSSQITKLHKVLKKHYKPITPDPNRAVLDQLIFGCCLEDSDYDAAEQALAALDASFFDWNEIRVSTIRELAEAMSTLYDPPAAAGRVKRVLQHVFEATYSFDLESVRKKNLGPATEYLAKIDGATPFAVAHVTQTSLGGHAIPIDFGAAAVMYVVGACDEKHRDQRAVPGLERAIPKSKGIEFASLLHQLTAAFLKTPHSPAIHKTLMEVDSDAKSRLPKKGTSLAEWAGIAPTAEPSGEDTTDEDDAGQNGEAAESAGEKAGKKSKGAAAGRAQTKAKSKSAEKAKSGKSKAAPSEPEEGGKESKSSRSKPRASRKSAKKPGSSQASVEESGDESSSGRKSRSPKSSGGSKGRKGRASSGLSKKKPR